MTASIERGHGVSLHKVVESPESGFGYALDQELEIRAKAELWNSFTPETCPHASWLDGALCGLCGSKYKVSLLNNA